MTYPVIDISEYQGEVDFQKVKKSGIAGIILRCGYSGYGSGKQKREDSRFRSYYQKAVAAGMPVGAYYYSTAASAEKARAEADFVLQLLKERRFAYPIYWDTEDEYHQAKLSPERLTEIAKAFLERVQEAGYYVGIYSYRYWLQTRLNMEALAAFDVWVASYTNTLDYTGHYGMWQYTSSGQVDGIWGPVDRSYAYYDYPSIIRKAGLNGLKESQGSLLIKYQRWLKDEYQVPLSIDGIWGPATQSATIQAVQQEERKAGYSIAVDGIWGPRTKAACPNIAIGQENAYVWILQGLLLKFSYILTPDGIFGERTEECVRAFQKRVHLVADGIAGPDTFEALIEGNY